ncbi:Ankyrin repeat-containing domain protein [Lactarius tabidus]
MSSSSETLEPSSHFQSILDAALSEYKSTTGNGLADNELAKELQGCESAEAVLEIIRREAKAFDQFRDGDKRLMKWIGPSVDVLYTISATLGQDVGMVFPAANVVSAGIGVLLVAAKDVKASHDVLVELLERVQFFLKRLGVHTRITPTEDLLEKLVTIMAEVLSILAIATKEVQQSRTEALFGRTDTEDALKKLDDLTQEVFQMATPQTLDHGANANLETDLGETALHIVSRGDYTSQEQGVSTARLLLECGVDVNARQKNGWTSLHWAAYKGKVEVAQVLLDYGANAKVKTRLGDTVLHLVSRGEYYSQDHGAGITRLFLEHGVDLDVQNDCLDTALHWAASKGRLEIAQLLLDHGANPNLVSELGWMPLHLVHREKPTSVISR